MKVVFQHVDFYEFVDAFRLEYLHGDIFHFFAFDAFIDVDSLIGALLVGVKEGQILALSILNMNSFELFHCFVDHLVHVFIFMLLLILLYLLQL